MQLSIGSLAQCLLATLYYLTLCRAHSNPNTYKMNQGGENQGGHHHGGQVGGEPKVDIDAEWVKDIIFAQQKKLPVMY